MIHPKGLTIEQAAAIIKQYLEDEEAERRVFLQAIGGVDIETDIPGLNEAQRRLFDSGIPTAYLKDWITKARQGEAFPLLRVYDQFNCDIHTMAVAQQAAEQSYPLHALLGQGCVERLRSESNSRNGKKRRNKPAQLLSQSICALAKEYPEEKGQRLSFEALLDIFREDVSSSATETCMEDLRNAGMMHIRIQEVDDQRERVYYRLTNGTEPKPISFKRLRNLLTPSSNPDITG